MPVIGHRRRRYRLRTAPTPAHRIAAAWCASTGFSEKIPGIRTAPRTEPVLRGEPAAGAGAALGAAACLVRTAHAAGATVRSVV